MCQAWYVTSGYGNDYDNTQLWEFGIEVVMMGYYAMYVTAIVKTLMLCKPHEWNQFGVTICLFVRSIPAILLHHGIKAFEVSVADAAAEMET
eukprot:3751643-Ditylum_brightwellii.AAC.1